MSLYNLLFGKNAHTEMILAIVGLKECDIERFRDVSLGEDGKTVDVYTRTGGGNREDYPNLLMRKRPEWRNSIDDDFDTTYCTDTLLVPEEFVEDVLHLSEPMKYGLRAEFAAHLGKTILREPTENDKRAEAARREAASLRGLKHELANGHTFVPYNDGAMLAALKAAEANGGELLTAWGILPLKLNVRQNYQPFPNAKDPKFAAQIERVEIRSEWEIDDAYWQHCLELFGADFPITMGKIAEGVARTKARR